MPDSGTIDITNLVEMLRSTFVTWGVNYIFAMVIAVPGLQWLGAPIISTIFRKCLSWCLDALSNSAVLLAFFANTAIRKSSQAKDFVNAVMAKNNLPQDVSDEVYAKAEATQMAAFHNFVMVTN